MSTPLRKLVYLASASTFCCAAFAPLAQAQTSPYYVGVAQTIQHESNLIRLRDGQALPAGRSESDIVSSTALVAGVDQTFGRQRLTGSASLRANRYSENSSFNSQGYSLNMGLDWQTIESLKGNVTVGADRSQRPDLRDRNGQYLSTGNNENIERVNATVSMGVAGPLALEAGVNALRTRYAASGASYAEYQQNGASAGVRYRLGGSTSVALTLRHSNIQYPNLLINQADPNDRRRRNDVEISGVWAATGASSFDARLSQGKTRYDQLNSRDFSGNTGSVAWTWLPSGKLRVTTRLARDSGQNASLATTAFSQLTDTLSINADYQLSGKITASAGLNRNRRQLDGSGLNVAGASGSDDGGSASIGLRWAVLRSATLGCTASTESRGKNSNPLLNEAYSANVFSCFGQLVLQ